MNFYSIRGRGNPNDSGFQDYVAVLYSLAYAVRMSYKNPDPPPGYFEYTVYPLEGVWDISDEAKARVSSTLDKDTLVFQLMIRQPDFVDPVFAAHIKDQVKRKKPHDLFDKVEFITIDEGPCVQMMHLGSYDTEPASFTEMETFCTAMSLHRTSKLHREIYISDPRKVEVASMRTVLRFQTEQA